MTVEEQPAAGMAMPEPQAEHRWLERLVGAWTVESGVGIDGWTETVRSVGGLWTVAEGRGEIPTCGEHTTIMTLGFDPQKGKFVGSFVGSMMTHQWVYEGTLQDDRLVLFAVGPDMTGSGPMKTYRDTITLLPDGRRELMSEVEGDDGSWTEFMRASYRRT